MSTVVIAIGAALLIVGSIHYYLWSRLVRHTTRPGKARRVGTLAVVILALLVPATFIGVEGAGADWLAWPGYLWLGLMFYLLVFLLVLEVPRFVLLRSSKPEDPPPSEGPTRRVVLSRGLALTAGIAASGTVGYGITQALGGPVIDRQRLVLPRLPRSMDGTRLVVVADIHIGPMAGEAHVRRIVDRINDLDADVVAIVGDLVDGSVEHRGSAADPLARIRSRHGSYFVTGNHEYYSGHEDWLERLEDLGVRTLRNERTALSIRGGVLDLAGVNDVAGADFDDPADFARTFAGRDPDRPVVLMAHQPVQAHEAAKYGVDLQVSGHTHGGQMAPFNLLVGLDQPVVSGLGDVDGVPVYVTDGAGFWGPPVRVGAPPQVSLLELRSP